MKSPRLLAALAALLPTLASAGSVYNLWAGNSASVTALGTTYAATTSDATLSYNRGTSFAFAYGRAMTSAGLYEFQLVSVSLSSPGYRLDGYWNVSRDGTLLCGQCYGSADGLSSGAGKPFTITVDGSNYKLTATINGHHDIYF